VMKRKCCDCIRKLDAQFKKEGIPLRVDAMIGIDFTHGSMRSYMQIATIRTDKKRNKLKTVCAYCPVCGKKYDLKTRIDGG
jgi:hypothetical protein